MDDLDLSQPAPQFEGIPREAQALLDQLWRIVAEQAKRLEHLESKSSDSRTSSKPPSSDDAQSRAERHRKTGSGRKQGGQPGHQGHHRGLVSDTEVDEMQSHYPPSACRCGGQVVSLPGYQRHQVFDLPKIRYQVTEHQIYQGRCCCCGLHHRGELPAEVPRGQMGAGLRADVALLNSQYRLSLRQVQRYVQHRWHLHFSLGALSETQAPVSEWLKPCYDQIGHWLRQQPQLHADETIHYHHRSRFWLWTMCQAQAAYFMIHPGRGKQAARALLGAYSGVLSTDLVKAFDTSQLSGFWSAQELLFKRIWTDVLQR